MGGVLDIDFAPNGDLFVLTMVSPPGHPHPERDAKDWLPDVVHLTKDAKYVNAWGGPDHIPAVDGISQWPAGREGLECDDDGNIWIFGYYKDDDAVLKLSPKGELLLRIGQRGKLGNDDDTKLVGTPTSCYHNTKTREVFISDGYKNHRIIAFNSDTGEFTRMWGAYGKKPSSLSPEEGFSNPVHKVVAGPDGRIYVCDRIKNRVQEFELIPGGARFLREVTVAPGTQAYGAAFDLGFAPGGKYIYIADGSNSRIWVVDLDSFAVLGWSSTDSAPEGDNNAPRDIGTSPHRFKVEPSGDLLLACTGKGIQRMKYLGVH
jgi:DNA-binding beta-propeller fold protein YncE